MEGKPFELDIKHYHISYWTGCMMEEPLQKLPSYFEAWNQLALSVSDLVREGRVREEVNKLPVLDHTKLEGYRQLRLAHLQLAFITAGYVWQHGDKGAIKALPKSIAIPFYHVSKQLGVHPILCHMDLVLSNFTLQYNNGPCDLTNIDCYYCLPGEDQGKWFATVTMLVELEFAKCLQPLEATVNLIQQSTSEKEETWQYYNMQDITRHLRDICDCIHSMKAAVERMHDNLPAKTFFNVLRPFLGGWGGDGNIMPEGLIYEGVSEQPIQLAGGSAAQSTSLQALDAFFGVVHTGEGKEFLLKMRTSMPPDHVRFIEDLEKHSNLLKYVKEMDVPSLSDAYNNCIKALLDFRAYHINIVKKYIITASKTTNEGNYKSLDEKGTGGTDLIPFLSSIVKSTQKKIMSGLKSNLPSEDKEQNNRGPNFSLVLGLVVSAFVAYVYVVNRKVLRS